MTSRSDSQISGPDWIKSKTVRFVIVAQAPGRSADAADAAGGKGRAEDPRREALRAFPRQPGTRSHFAQPVAALDAGDAALPFRAAAPRAGHDRTQRSF